MSYINKFKQGVVSIKTNLRGWKTNRKIIVIESDDWGSIRMPSKNVYNQCLNAGYKVDKNIYEKYDSLASEDDLELLFGLLTKYNDKNNNHPVFTANCVTANPDFDKIRESNFQTYYYQSIEDTFKEYPRHQNNMNLWKSGLNSNIFFPQFHAREHLNISLFLSHLQQSEPDVLFGFNHKMPGAISKNNFKIGNVYVEATNFNTEQDKIEKEKILIEGLQMFENIFNFKSESYIPTNYIVSSDFYPALYANGVKFIQGSRVLIEPVTDEDNILHKRYLGQKEQSGLVALVRNCRFEPTLIRSSNEVQYCMRDIQNAFSFHKPAIISSHRLNYVGYIDEKNRDQNLNFLKQLLDNIINKWPDVEFMTSAELGKIILKNE